MFNALRSFLSRFKAEGYEEIETPQGIEVAFTLRYRELIVGTLRLKDGIWEFRYSAEFKKQTLLQPLIAFPDTEKVYVSDTLWPFFMSRLPSVSQPDIRETLRQEGLDERSAVDLLRRFGESTISNPFVLEEIPPSKAGDDIDENPPKRTVRRHLVRAS